MNVSATLLVLMILKLKDVTGWTFEDFLVFRVQKGMFLMDLAGGKYIHPNMSHFPRELPLAVDPSANRLYVGCCGATISAYDIRNDTFTGGVHVEPQREPQGAPFIKDGDLDPLSGLLFVTDFNRGRILAFSSDLGKEWTVVDNTRNPYAIAVDPVNRLMFWSSTYAKTIERSYLDGREQKVIIQHDLQKVVAMTVDMKEHRLFWADLDLEHIDSSDLEGQRRRLVLTARRHQIRGLAVDDDFVYYTSYSTNNVFKANKFDGSGVTKLGDIGSDSYDDGTQVDGMVIRKQSLIVKGNSTCSFNNGGCPHLCIPTPEGHTCAGPTNTFTVISTKATPSTASTTTTVTTTTSPVTSTTTTTSTKATRATTTVTTLTTTAKQVTSTAQQSTSTTSSAYPTLSKASLPSITSSKSPSMIHRTSPTIAMTSVTSVEDDDILTTAGVTDLTEESPVRWILTGLFISFIVIIGVGILVWIMFKRKRNKPVKMVVNPAYVNRGQNLAAPPSYIDDENDLYSEIATYNHSNPQHHQYAAVDERNYYNAGSDNGSDRNDEEGNNGCSKINDGYEVPLSTTYADMRPKSQMPLLAEDGPKDVNEPDSQHYEKFDGGLSLSQPDAVSDTYAMGPPIENVSSRKPKEHNYMNTVKRGEGQSSDLERAEPRVPSVIDDTYEIPLSHEYRNVLVLATLKRDTNI